jgi:hypothetical protein
MYIRNSAYWSNSQCRRQGAIRGMSKETLMIGNPGQNQHATQEAWFLDGFIFNRLRA